MGGSADFSPTRFAVIGAGPVGSVVAGHLAAKGFEVTLCDIVEDLLRPALDPGIEIEGADSLSGAKVTRVTTHVDELGDFDPEVIFVTTKATALPLLASAIQGFHREGMYVVSWQNGIDTELVLAEALGRPWVMRAVVNMGVGLAGPGRVHMAFHHPPHYVQELDPAGRAAAEGVAQALTAAGLPTEHTDQLVSMVWRKTIMNASMNPVCALTGMTMAQAMQDPFVAGIVDQLVKEGIQVARANEISLGWDYYRYCMNYLRSAGNHKPSMLMDVEAKRRTEIDYINGKIVEYGEMAGIPTPYNQMIQALVKGREETLR
ncbi:ketopantoate reductase family protein [Deferrisoma sp.]